MSNFARRSSQPCIEASVLHDTGADACSYEETDEIVISATRTVKIFTEGRNLNIVSHTDWDPKMLAKNIPQRHISHAQIGSIDNNTSFPVDLTGSTNANSNNSRTIGQLSSI